MKQYLKNPNFYYIAVPVLFGVWAILAAFVFYPASAQAWEDEKSEFETTKEWIEKLVALQPKRLAYKVDDKAKSGDFDFTVAIDEFAQVFRIPPSNYKLNVRGQVKKAKRLTRSANVDIKNIDVQTLAQFLSGLLLRWPDLKCEVISLQRTKNAKNTWKATLRLTYYY